MKQRIDLIVNPRDAIDAQEERTLGNYAWWHANARAIDGNCGVASGEQVQKCLGSRVALSVTGLWQARYSRPSTPLPWVTFKATGIPVLDPALTPADLDVQLPMRFFSMRFFRDRLFQLGITIAKTISEPWRTLLVFFPDTENVFTVDLIEPHVAATHDAIDFDVNNMYLTKEVLGIGLRVDVTDEPLLLSLESHVPECAA